MGADFYLRLALASLIICGVWSAFGADMIFYRLGDWAERRVSKWITKPLFGCPVCMSSLYGTTVWFWTGGAFSFWWPAFVLALAGWMKVVSGRLLK